MNWKFVRKDTKIVFSATLQKIGACKVQQGCWHKNAHMFSWAITVTRYVYARVSNPSHFYLWILNFFIWIHLKMHQSLKYQSGKFITILLIKGFPNYRENYNKTGQSNKKAWFTPSMPLNLPVILHVTIRTFSLPEYIFLPFTFVYLGSSCVQEDLVYWTPYYPLYCRHLLTASSRTVFTTVIKMLVASLCAAVMTAWWAAGLSLLTAVLRKPATRMMMKSLCVNVVIVLNVNTVE